MPPAALEAMPPQPNSAMSDKQQAELSISLLGNFQIVLHGQAVTNFATAKVQALLLYLVVEADQAHSRPTLAHLLWPDQPDNVALHSLRQALVSLRRAIGDREASPPFLHITRQALQFNPDSSYWLDATAFTRLLDMNRSLHPDTIAQWRHAVTLYQGDFLAGFHLDNNLPFEEWVQTYRENYRQRATETLNLLASHYEQQGDYKQSLDSAQQGLKLAPWQEETQRRVMRCLALSGRRNAALAQYKTLRQTET